eukprot:TRINITY_DN67390_c0_g1_i1.p1 TRINITY_DN67390_c0_g1~~TRINITY_DN67390_c0_g1_i1.p1  ORF type:complete len:380 (+),score=75.20 TRINITY_DN67390_c0_g1_i1:371-1510(+)
MLRLAVTLCVAGLVLARRHEIPEGEEFCFYSELGLNPDAETPHKDSEIKTAYRKLSREYHPDLHPGDTEKEMRFLRVQKAYRVLGDRLQRKIYDLTGHEGLRRYEEEKNRPEGMRQGFMPFFGQSGSGRDMKVPFTVSLEQIYNGETLTLNVKKNKVCSRCRGSGAHSKEHFKPCAVCDGRGHRVVAQQFGPFVQHVKQPCESCSGKGKIPTKSCPICGGKKIRNMVVPLELLLERGLPESHEVKFELEGDETPDQLPGDLVLVVSSAPHPVFRRDGHDLHITMKLTLLESLIGFRKAVTHLDGRQVVVSHVGVTAPGTRRQIKGEGMPVHHVPSDRGALHVTFEVDFPRVLTGAQNKAIDAAFGNDRPASYRPRAPAD